MERGRKDAERVSPSRSWNHKAWGGVGNISGHKQSTGTAMIPVTAAQVLTKHPTDKQMMSVHWKTTAQARRRVKTRANYSSEWTKKEQIR